MKTILMANSQKVFSNTLFAMLESRYEGLKIFIAKDDDLAKLLKKGKYDLVIINSNINAFALSKELMLCGITIPILVHTETNYLPYIKTLYKLGVSGVLNASTGEHEVLKAVTDVLANRIYLSENLKQELIRYSMATIGDAEDLDEDFLSQKSYVENFHKKNSHAFINSSIIAHAQQCLN